MKTQEMLLAALEVKEKNLQEVSAKLCSLNEWIMANDAFARSDKSYENLILFLEEKVNLKHRVIQLEEQVKILQWVLQ